MELFKKYWSDYSVSKIPNYFLIVIIFFELHGNGLDKKTPVHIKMQFLLR